MTNALRVDERLEALEGKVESLEVRSGGTPGGQCSAEMPHPEGLVYMRGPNRYQCRCGKAYLKDGAGGLKEV